MAPDERPDRPEWWEWELAFTPHVEARMDERGFSEAEVRAVLDDATTVTPSRRPGRFLLHTRRFEQPLPRRPAGAEEYPNDRGGP